MSYGVECIKNAPAGKTATGDGTDPTATPGRTTMTRFDAAGARRGMAEAATAYMAANPTAANPTAADREVGPFGFAMQQLASALTLQERISCTLAAHAVFTSDFCKNQEAPKFAPLLSRVTDGSRIMVRHWIGADVGGSVRRRAPRALPSSSSSCTTKTRWTSRQSWSGPTRGGQVREHYTREEVDEKTRAALRGEAEPLVVGLAMMKTTTKCYTDSYYLKL
jgi:hypothetical protein